MTGIVRGGVRVILRNDAEYLRFLEEGSSSQAPAGFVTDAMRVWLLRVNEVINTAITQVLNAEFAAVFESIASAPVVVAPNRVLLPRGLVV